MNRKLARKKKIQRNGTILLGLAVLAILITVIVRSNVYVLKNIEIEGNSYFTENEIIRKAKITPGGSIFDISEESIRRAFEEEGAVQLLDVEIIKPDTLKLTVRESTAHAVASFAGMLVVLDEEGYVIETTTSDSGYAVPSVNGLEMQLCKVGKRIECSTSGMLESYCAVIGAVYELNLQEEISEISLYNLDSITLATKTGILVKAGDRSDIKEKLQLMMVCLKDQVSQGKSSGVIDVTSSKAAYYSEN